MLYVIEIFIQYPYIYIYNIAQNRENIKILSQSEFSNQYCKNVISKKRKKRSWKLKKNKIPITIVKMKKISNKYRYILIL